LELGNYLVSCAVADLGGYGAQFEPGMPAELSLAPEVCCRGNLREQAPRTAPADLRAHLARRCIHVKMLFQELLHLLQSACPNVCSRGDLQASSSRAALLLSVSNPLK
jgi:hypothetical protein